MNGYLYSHYTHIKDMICGLSDYINILTGYLIMTPNEDSNYRDGYSALGGHKYTIRSYLIMELRTSAGYQFCIQIKHYVNQDINPNQMLFDGGVIKSYGSHHRRNLELFIKFYNKTTEFYKKLYSIQNISLSHDYIDFYKIC